MKVLLIRPPYTRLRGAGQAAYFPLGVGYIASYLKTLGHDCKIYNVENSAPGEPRFMINKEDVFGHRAAARKRYLAALESDDHPVWREVAEVVRSYRPDLVGLSLLTVEFGSALKCSRIVKSVLPGTPVIWGGAHPTFLPDTCLAYGEVDFAAGGEGELTMGELCRELAGGQDFSSIAGLSHKRGGAIVHNPERELMADLDQLPPPARSEVIFPERFDALAMGSITYSRGCPFKCTFCSSRIFWQKKVRFRKPELVVEEVKDVVKTYGVSSFTFWDDTFTVNRQIALDLCRALRDSGVPVTWKTATRADVLDDEILQAMREGGCIQLQLGIETGSMRMSKLIEKDVELKAAYHAVRMINRHGIAAGTFFIVGYPQETVEDMRQTFEMMKSIGTTDVVLNVFDPMPGSSLFDTTKDQGLLPTDDLAIDWPTYPLWPDAHYVSAVDREEFGRTVREISEWCFKYNHSPAALLRRLRPQLGYLLKNDRALLVRKGLGFVRKRLSPARSTTPWPAW